MSDDAKGDIFDGVEDPGQYWVDLVEAYRSHDLNGVRAIILAAKASKWTNKMWADTLLPEKGDLGDDEEGWTSE